MPEPRTADSDRSTQQARLELIRRKRAALEQLLLLAHQLSRMQGGMNMLQQMLKPSQAPGRKVSAIEELAAGLGDRATAELQRQLAALDQSIARELSSVVVLSRLTQEEFIQRYCESKGAADAAALLERQLEDFRRNSQLNVAIRYTLHRRGIQLRAADLPIAQEAVGQRLEALRAEEQRCRQQLAQRAQDLLGEVDAALADPACAPAERLQHRATRRGLEVALRTLAAGDSLEDLPLALATAADGDVDADEKPLVEQRAHEPPVATKTAAPAATPSPRKLGFWRKLQLWLNTPWQTKWKDIEDKKDKR
jgi:hypothetical protein